MPHDKPSRLIKKQTRSAPKSQAKRRPMPQLREDDKRRPMPQLRENDFHDWGEEQAWWDEQEEVAAQAFEAFALQASLLRGAGAGQAELDPDFLWGVCCSTDDGAMAAAN